MNKKQDWKHKDEYCKCIVSLSRGGIRCANCGKLLRPLNEKERKMVEAELQKARGE